MMNNLRFLAAILGLVSCCCVACTEKVISVEPVPSGPLQVTLEKNTAEFTYGESGVINYTYTGGPEKDITVEFPQSEDFEFSNQASNGSGKITITGKENKAAVFSGTFNFLCGKDEAMEVDYKIIKMRQTKLIDRTKLPHVNVDEKYRNAIVYTTPADSALVIPFTITGEPATSISTTEDGLDVASILLKGGTSGQVEIRAAEGSTWSSMLFTIKATNAEGADSAAFYIQRAYLSWNPVNTITLNRDGESRKFQLNTNVACEVSLKDEDSWYSASCDEYNRLIVTCQKNETFYRRFGAVTVKDKAGLLTPVNIEFKQDRQATSAATDKLALGAFYTANHGNLWAKYDWSTTELPMEEWGYMSAGDFFRGRLTQFTVCPWCDHKNVPAGYLPEEIGMLDEVGFIEIGGHRLAGPIPSTFTNLTKLYYVDMECGGIRNDWPEAGLTGTLSDEWIKALVNRKDDNLRTIDLRGNRFTGGVPAYLAEPMNRTYTDDGKAKVHIFFVANHISGQVPKEVAESVYWNEIWYNDVTWGEFNLYQSDDYALWVGEKPDDVIWKGDHWEWKPGTNPRTSPFFDGTNAVYR